MTADVINLKREIVGDGITVDPDKILKALEGKFVEVAIVGVDKDGEVCLHASHGSEKTVWLLEAGKILGMKASMAE